MGFQVGTQIRPELANADYSGFANAASIRAQALADLGEKVGGAITKYQVDKQKKDDQNNLYQAILPYATQYASSPEEADAMAKTFSKNPNVGATILQLAGVQKDTEILNQAFAVNTDTEGEVDYGRVVQSYIDLGGKDPAMVIGLSEEAKSKEDFRGRVYTDKGFTFAQTSRGSAQVVDTPDDDQDGVTASMQNTKYIEERYNEARELYEKGDIDKANAIIFALGRKNEYGEFVTADTLFGNKQIIPSTTNKLPEDSLELGL